MSPISASGRPRFTSSFDDSGEQVHADPGDSHRSRQTHTAQGERDNYRDRDREEDAVLHEGPDQIIERVRQRVDGNEQRLFPSNESPSSHGGSRDE